MIMSSLSRTRADPGRPTCQTRGMAGDDVVRAWRPRVDGVAEVLHAAWRDHAYPAHTHDTWTLLLADDGRVSYELDRHGHAAVISGVTLLPPHVVHDGRPATARGFRKRVVYLHENAVDKILKGAHLHP